jgi:hypothetical protein
MCDEIVLILFCFSYSYLIKKIAYKKSLITSSLLSFNTRKKSKRIIKEII